MDKKTHKILTLSVFFITLVYPPLVTYEFLSDSFRIGLFGLILIAMLIIQSLRYYKRKKIPLIITIWIIFIIYMIASLYVNGETGFKSALGYAVILGFSISLFTIIKSERYEYFYNTILNSYRNFFFIVPVFCIINFLLNIVSPSVNFLTGFFFTDNQYNYHISPFGLSLGKPIFGVNLVRCFFFFIEPVYLALFYLFNVFIIGPAMTRKRSTFIVLNIIGGVITFSYLFFAGYLIMKLIKMRMLYKVLTISLIILALLIFQEMFLPELVESSSIDNRLFRLATAIEFIQNIPMQKIFFGIGIEYDYTSNFGINAGLLSSVIENGILGLLSLLIIMILFAQKNAKVIIIIFLALLTVAPFKLPLFWLTVILAGEVARKERTQRSILIGQHA